MTKDLDGRARVASSIHSFFASRGFLHVDTPVLVPSPGMDVQLETFAVDVGPSRRFWLATSPEYQMKRVLAEGHPRIYQMTRSFRKDELGHLHNPEFSMLEWYRRDADVADVMRDTEQLVARTTGGVVHAFGRAFSTAPPYPRVTVCEAFERWAAIPADETLTMAGVDEDRFFTILVDKVEPRLADLGCVFLTEYPASMASLARKKPGDPRVAERFELYVAGVELCNGFGELVDPVEQRSRFEEDQGVRRARSLDVYPIDEKLMGVLGTLPPCAGNALGVDRLAMLACGRNAIGDVMAFTLEDL